MKRNHTVRLKGEHCPNFVACYIGKQDAKNNLIHLDNKTNQISSDFIVQKEMALSEYASKLLDSTFKNIAKQVVEHQRTTAKLKTLRTQLSTLSMASTGKETPAETRALHANKQSVQQITQSLASLEDEQINLEADIRVFSHETLQLLLSKQAILQRQLAAYLKGVRRYSETLNPQKTLTFPTAQLEAIEALKSFVTYEKFLPGITLNTPNMPNTANSLI